MYHLHQHLGHAQAFQAHGLGFHCGEQGAVLPAVLVQAPAQTSDLLHALVQRFQRHGHAGVLQHLGVHVVPEPQLRHGEQLAHIVMQFAPHLAQGLSRGLALGLPQLPVALQVQFGQFGPVPVAAVGSTNDDDEQRRCQYQQRQ